MRLRVKAFLFALSGRDDVPSIVLSRWPRQAVSVIHRSGVRPSVCPIFFPTLILRTPYTQRDSLRAASDSASVHLDSMEFSYVLARMELP